MNNKYSNLKIAWFPEKLKSLKDCQITPPVCVRIKPTNRCCHNCYFCVYNYDFSKMHENVYRSDEISLTKMFEILEDLSEMGVKAVTYSGGGEPLFHRDIEAILQKTLDCNLDLSMLTNGQGLTMNISEKMVHAKWIRISMDYWNEKIFSKTRRINEKFFNTIVENIKGFAAINKNCDLGINYIITKENYDTLIEASEFMLSLGVNNIRFSPLWVPNFYEYHCGIEKIVQQQLKEIYHNYSKDIIYDSYKIVPDVTKRPYSTCYFMQIVPVIGADYNVYNCHNKAYDQNGLIGSIRDKKFSKVWYSLKTAEYFKTFRPDKVCNHQCANDQKNKNIHEILKCFGDNYV